MPEKKQPEKSPKSAKAEKAAAPEDTAGKVREQAAAKAEKVAEATLSRYMSWVEDLKGRHAFRGQADAGWRLQASAYRRMLKQTSHPELTASAFVGYLHERISEATMRFSACRDLQPLEVMAWMQHHGAATGLIDFTESVLAALWFACKDEQGKSGKVVAIRLDDSGKIQEIRKRGDMEGKELEYFFPFYPSKKLWVWRPGDSDPRMVTQQSLFIFGRPEIEDEFVDDAFPVSAEEKGRYMEILEKSGVSENFIFSDFAGFAAANSSDKDYPLQRAEIYYTEKIGEVSDDARLSLLYFQKGVFNTVLGAYEKAIEDYTRAIDLGPSKLRPEVLYNNRGLAYSGLGRFEEACSDYTNAIKHNPQHALVHFNRGIACTDLGRIEEALASYDKALELDPKYAWAHSNRGNVLNRLGRFGEALAACDKAIELDPKLPEARFNRGNALHRLKRPDEACVAWKEAKRLAELSGNMEVVKAASDNLAKFCK